MSLAHLTRYLIYSSDKATVHKCVVAAMTKREAMRIARDNGLRLGPTASAVEERRPA